LILDGNPDTNEAGQQISLLILIKGSHLKQAEEEYNQIAQVHLEKRK